MRQYEVAVLGGGPGGYTAAIRAGQLGKKTVLVEKRDLGGTCLNRGCIPTKALLHSAEAYHQLGSAKSLGITLGEYSFQYKKMARRKDKVVKQLRSGVESLVSGHGADIVRGEAVLTGPHTFRVGEEEFEAEQLILATGSVPASIPVPGTDKPGVLNSDGVLALEECPESVVIIGGGVIGVEFATLFCDLGKPVTIVEMLPSILYGNDPDVCSTMTGLLQDRGVTIHTGAKVLEIQDGLTCVFEKEGQTLTARGQVVILSTGRRPETANLGLEAAGVAAQRGFVTVDDEMRTNVPHIYAIGDITGRQQLAHVATAQGIVAAHNAAGEHRKMDYSAVPGCIYTSPEIASIGITADEAKAAGRAVKVGKFVMFANGKTVIADGERGFIKVVADADTGVILGAQLMCERATDMLSQLTAAVVNGLTAHQLLKVMRPHPTFEEGVGEALEDLAEKLKK